MSGTARAVSRRLFTSLLRATGPSGAGGMGMGATAEGSVASWRIGATSTHPGVVPERWFASHISRQDDKKGTGKGKKKKGGAGKGKKKAGSGGQGTARAGVVAAKVAARDEAAREQGVAESMTTSTTTTSTTMTSSTMTSSTSHASSPATSHATSPATSPTTAFVYAGPFSNAVTKVKKLSVFSCVVTMSSVPIMLYLDPAVLVDGAAATSMTARMSLAGSLSAFGVGTTGLLHYFVKPYVHSLTYAGDGKVRVETLDFLARRRSTELALQDVDGGAADSMHPLSTFRDRRDGKVYYVDRDFFHHDELLAVLDPKPQGDDGDDKASWSD